MKPFLFQIAPTYGRYVKLTVSSVSYDINLLTLCFGLFPTFTLLGCLKIKSCKTMNIVFILLTQGGILMSPY